jgi:hypothetical protein
MRLLNLRRTAALLAIVVSTNAALAADSAGCQASQADTTQVIEAMRTMYAAAATEDLARFHSVASAKFYAFDGGKRFDGDALMDTVKRLHAAGSIYVWNVTEPEAHVTCSLAWITYTNRGSVQNASGTKDLVWLESAVLEKEAGVWRVLFLHSTRVP